MRVRELSGGLLDYWVARATGKGCWDWSDGTKVTYADWRKHHSLHARFTNHSMEAFRPSTSWAHGGPLIESEGIATYRNYIRDGSGRFDGWIAAVGSPANVSTGETLLVAAMRAYVASKFGDEVLDEEAA
jgi:hypothetical protein